MLDRALSDMLADGGVVSLVLHSCLLRSQFFSTPPTHVHAFPVQHPASFLFGSHAHAPCQEDRRALQATAQHVLASYSLDDDAENVANSDDGDGTLYSPSYTVLLVLFASQVLNAYLVLIHDGTTRASVQMLA